MAQRTSRWRPPASRANPMAIETTPDKAATPASGVRPFDPEVVRRDFPILDQEINGHRLVYLDSASSSQKPRAVIEAVDTYYREYNANVHRGIYTIGEKSTAEYEKARARVARFINAPDSHEVVFTRNATEAINLVAYSWGRKNISRGDAIVLTEMEHHANLVPWQLLVQEKDGDLEFIPITDDGLLRLDVYEVLLRLKPKLVAFTHVSNTLGTINPVREMVAAAHAAGALVLVDGAQAVPHVPVDVQDLGADFYAFSGHKMLAPMGSGALWARRELLEAMPPFLAGGEMIREVHLRRSSGTTSPGSSRRGRRPSPTRSGWAWRPSTSWTSGWMPSARTSATSSGTRSRRSPRACPGSSSTARCRQSSAAGSSRSTCPGSTRTTWPRCWTGSGSPFGPATTARCRSTSGSTLPRRRGRPSTSTRRARTSTRSSRGCSTCSGSSAPGDRSRAEPAGAWRARRMAAGRKRPVGAPGRRWWREPLPVPSLVPWPRS